MNQPASIDAPHMCPHCGRRFYRLVRSNIRWHKFEGRECPGVGQHPRNPESDRRRLWKDGGHG